MTYIDDEAEVGIRSTVELAKQYPMDQVIELLEFMANKYIEVAKVADGQTEVVEEIARFVGNPDNYAAGHKWLVNGMVRIVGSDELWERK